MAAGYNLSPLPHSNRVHSQSLLATHIQQIHLVQLIVVDFLRENHFWFLHVAVQVSFRYKTNLSIMLTRSSSLWNWFLEKKNFKQEARSVEGKPPVFRQVGDGSGVQPVQARPIEINDNKSSIFCHLLYFTPPPHTHSEQFSLPLALVTYKLQCTLK